MTAADPGGRERFWRAAALGFALLAVGLALLAAWALGRGFGVEPVPIRGAGREAALPPPLPRLDLAPASLADLPGWATDRQSEALAAFLRTCAGLDAGKSGGGLGRALAGAAPALAGICAGARAVPRGDDGAARTFIERAFTPWLATNRGDAGGLLTGYYEPELEGRKRKQAPFVHPLYRDPGERQVIDLGEFKADLAGRRITGFLRGGRFRPYWDRAEIERGALAGRRLELAWVKDPVALFFLQIQGSGRIRFDDGKLLRVGYAGQNGHDYTAIGRVLIERGELAREAVSLQTIRAWLAAHPGEADEVMNRNRSYVFFRVLPGAPTGASGAELTPGRSLAVDPAFWPYGVPLWVASERPAAPELGTAAAPLAALVVAQDTGGAIRGPVRGDLFLGPGAEAEAIAGRMKQPLRLWLLWPRALGAPPRPAA